MSEMGDNNKDSNQNADQPKAEENKTDAPVEG